jgi:predicted alpha/beta-hydrolase family hydrolase
VRFEFPYMDQLRRTQKRAPPNRMPVLEESFERVLAGLPEPAFIGGKSMGGRVATHIADRVEARGVVVLGYPFHPPGQPDKLRVEHLRTLRTRCLIVQGTRDPLGTPAEVAHYPLAKKTRLEWLADGDHSFVPRRSSGRTLEQNLAQAVSAIVRFMRAGRARP